MLLNEPPESDYDLRFQLFGFPIRVAWTFWVAAAVLGYQISRDIDRLFAESSPGMFAWLIVWAGVLFGSILIHELGHAFVFRHCGINASIVLYHFGGLAIPVANRRVGASRHNLGKFDTIAISAAGPVAQLLLALLTLGALKISGYSLLAGELDVNGDVQFTIPVGPAFLAWIPGVMEGQPITTPAMFALLDFLLYVNIWWAIFNLVPVWPLDGGQIAREVILLSGGTSYFAAQVSMIVAGLMALVMFRLDQPLTGILFVSLAIGSYQMLTALGQWRM